MKMTKKCLKYIIFAAIIVSVILVSCPTGTVRAASGGITVTSVLTGEKLYSGDDLQEAFDAAERGCIVSVDSYVTLHENVVLRVEVMLKNYSFIRFVPDTSDTSVYYQIQLAENGAIFSTDRIRTKYIGALHSYSEVDMVEENDGYVYYLISQAPAFEKAKPEISNENGIYGSLVDSEKGIMYLDLAVQGRSVDVLSPSVSIKAQNTEKITFTCQPGIVATGSVLTATASNYDFEGTDVVTYTLIVVGDVNSNGKIDSADAALISQHITGERILTDHALLAADANRDGVVNYKDAKLICEKYVRYEAYKSPLRQ